MAAPSAYMVSKARLDFPLPLRPVMTVILFWDRQRDIFKLCSRTANVYGER